MVYPTIGAIDSQVPTLPHLPPIDFTIELIPLRDADTSQL